MSGYGRPNNANNQKGAPFTDTPGPATGSNFGTVTGVGPGASNDSGTSDGGFTPNDNNTFQGLLDSKKGKGKGKGKGSSDAGPSNSAPPTNTVEPAAPNSTAGITANDLKNIKVHVSQPMPIPGSPNAPIFNGIDVSTYFRTLDRYFASYMVTNDREKKEWVVDYATPSQAWNIRKLPSFKTGTYASLKREVKQDYQADDSEYRLYTNAYLDLLEQDFKDAQIDGQPSPDQCRKFLRAFREVALNCVDRGNLTKKQASTRFMLALPRSLRNKAIQAASKNGESLKDLKTDAFDDIYSAVEAQLNSERDLYAIAEEQGITNHRWMQASRPNIFAETCDHREERVQPASMATQGQSTRAPLSQYPNFLGYRDNAPGEEIRKAFERQDREAMASLDPVFLPTLQKIARDPESTTDRDLENVCNGLGHMKILAAVVERATNARYTAEINILRFTEEAQEVASVSYGTSHPNSIAYNKKARDDYGCRWCMNRWEPGMRPQARHEFMNQCFDYKKFIGLGVIHEAEDNGYICMGPWEEGKKSYPVQFPTDGRPRREYILSRVLNSQYSPDPERRAQAVKELLASQLEAALAREKGATSAINCIEFIDEPIDAGESVILQQWDCSEEQIVQVQALLSNTKDSSDSEAMVAPIETRARKKAPAFEPYKGSDKLQDKIKAQASYGKPKVPLDVRDAVQFTEVMDVDSPEEARKTPQQILARNKSKISDMVSKPVVPTASRASARNTATSSSAKRRTAKPEPTVVPSGIPRPITRSTSSRNPRIQEALDRNGYRLDKVLDKLLSLQELPGNLTLGEIMVLIDPPRASRTPGGAIDRQMQREHVANVEAITFKDDYSLDREEVIISQRPLPDSSCTFPKPTLYADQLDEYPSTKRDNIRTKKVPSWLPGRTEWKRRVQAHPKVPRNLLALKFQAYQRWFRNSVSVTQESMIEKSVVWLLLSAIPLFGPVLVLFLSMLLVYRDLVLELLRLVPSTSPRTMRRSARLARNTSFCVKIEAMSGSTEIGNSFYSPAPKVVVTMPGRSKVSDVRATLDTGAEVSCMTLEAANLLELPITRSQTMALKTITGVKSRFVGFADNVTVAIGNCAINNRFYIMDSPGVKVILGFPFFRKARVTFRYPRDYDGGIVLASLWDQRSSLITTVRTNDATEEAKDAEALRGENGVGLIYPEDSESEIGYEEEDFSGND